eukprot:scaffold176_cov356-Prasinococcus_capsulatus_cf.AAC.1
MSAGSPPLGGLAAGHAAAAGIREGACRGSPAEQLRAARALSDEGVPGAAPCAWAGVAASATPAPLWRVRKEMAR